MTRAIDFFDAIARRYDRDYARDAVTLRRRIDRLVAAVGDARGKRLLDLGIGTGRELPALLDAGFDVTGVDASQRMLDECSKRARAPKLVRADFFDALPFLDAAFDGMLALHGTLAHPPNEGALAGLLSEAARVLTAGGVLFAEVPSPGWLDAIDAGQGNDDHREATRSDARRARLVDRQSKASIEALVLDRHEWRALLGPRFEASVEAISPYEWLLLGVRR